MYRNTACKQSYHNLHDTDTTLLLRRCRLLAKRILAFCRTEQAVGGRPPRYAPPLSSPVGAEVPRAAEQTAT